MIKAIKEIIMRCPDCWYEITLNAFEKLCFDACDGKEDMIGKLEDARCPCCDVGQLERWPT